MSKNQTKFKENFLKIINIFNKYPYMFYNFLNKNEAFNSKFKLKVEKITINKNNNFIDLETMLKFYLNLLNENENEITETKQSKEIIQNKKLYKAILEQKFELAAEYRDYMIKKNINILI